MINLFSNRLSQMLAADTGADGGESSQVEQTQTEETESVESDQESQNEAPEKAPSKPSNERMFSRKELAKIVSEEREKAKNEAKTEAEKLAGMNESQKVAYENEKLKAELAELQKAQTQSAMAKEASKMLSASGLTADDEVLDFVVKDTAEATQSAVQTFISLVDQAAESKTKAALSGKAPKVNTGSAKAMTKEEIMKIQDPTKRQQAIKDNITLFK